MTPFCLFDSPSIRTGGIGGHPDIALKPTVQTSPSRVLGVASVRTWTKARLCLASPKHRGSKGFPLGQVYKAERLVP